MHRQGGQLSLKLSVIIQTKVAFFYGFVNYVVEGDSSLEMEIIKVTGEPYFPVTLPLYWKQCVSTLVVNQILTD